MVEMAILAVERLEAFIPVVREAVMVAMERVAMATKVERGQEWISHPTSLTT